MGVSLVQLYALLDVFSWRLLRVQRRLPLAGYVAKPSAVMVGARGHDLALGFLCKAIIMCGEPEHRSERSTSSLVCLSSQRLAQVW